MGVSTQDDREQLCRREYLEAELLQVLARALVAGQLAPGRLVVQLCMSVWVGVCFEGKQGLAFFLGIVIAPPSSILKEVR